MKHKYYSILQNARIAYSFLSEATLPRQPHETDGECSLPWKEYMEQMSADSRVK